VPICQKLPIGSVWPRPSEPGLQVTRFSSQVDWLQRRRELERHGWVSISDILEEKLAQTLLKSLSVNAIWNLQFTDSGREFDLDQATTSAMQPQLKVGLGKRVASYPADGFQFCFDSYRISDLVDDGRPCLPAFEAFYKFLNSPDALETFRELTGDPAINYLDVQATRYRPGHFLTVHDDDASGKYRKFAFVMNLTPAWRADWGGLLQFLDSDGHVSRGLRPSWNTLNIFKVPQLHAVSMVTPAAIGARVSLTGWMRAVPEDSPLLTRFKHA
jgi:SM-20-related protein